MIALLLFPAFFLQQAPGSEPAAKAAYRVKPAISSPGDPPSSGPPARLLHYASWQFAGAVADLGSTEYCLHRNPTCREMNPFMQTTGQRIAMKVLTVGMFTMSASQLERSGHRGWARVITAFGVVLQLGAAINNVVVAHR